ncbi:MAG: protein rep [Bacteroidetes bacterium]|nr:protein rep [Bacteroidota bacterium]
MYWNTYHCFNKIFSSENSLFGKYCKNRFCPLCCGIRKAEILNKYLPVLSKWPNPFFLTLTAKSVPAEQLEKRTDEFFALMNRIISKQKKRHQRGKGFHPVGIKSFECNFNPKDKTYNPHFHLILPDLATADYFLTEWRKEGQKLWGEKP